MIKLFFFPAPSQALAKLRYRPDSPFLVAYLQAAAPRLPAFNSQDHCALAWALGQLGARPDSGFVRLLLQVGWAVACGCVCCGAVAACCCSWLWSWQRHLPNQLSLQQPVPCLLGASSERNSTVRPLFRSFQQKPQSPKP
jgi:hypothetical protein